MTEKEIPEVKKTKFISAFITLREALERLKENPKDRVIKDSVIKRFEYTFETGWKYIKSICENEGVSPKSPRETISKALEIGKINPEEAEIWYEMIAVRNLTVHTYDKELADEVVEKIRSKFFKVFRRIASGKVSKKSAIRVRTKRKLKK